jgi:hypothetical protein
MNKEFNALEEFEKADKQELMEEMLDDFMKLDKNPDAIDDEFLLNLNNSIKTKNTSETILDFENVVIDNFKLIPLDVNFRIHASKVLFVRRSTIKTYSLPACKLFATTFIGKKDNCNYLIAESINEINSVQTFITLIYIICSDNTRFDKTSIFHSIIDTEINSTVYIVNNESTFHVMLNRYFNILFQSVNIMQTFERCLSKKEKELSENNIEKLTSDIKDLILDGKVSFMSSSTIIKAQNVIAQSIKTQLDTRITLSPGEKIPNFWGIHIFFLPSHLKQKHLWIWGPKNKGKSYFAENLLKHFKSSFYIIGQESSNSIDKTTQIIILDEVEKKNKASKADLDMMCDGHYQFKQLYSNKFELTDPLIIVLSNYSIDLIYSTDEAVYVKARFREINVEFYKTWTEDTINLEGKDVKLKPFYEMNDIMPDFSTLVAQPRIHAQTDREIISDFFNKFNITKETNYLNKKREHNENSLNSSFSYSSFSKRQKLEDSSSYNPGKQFEYIDLEESENSFIAANKKRLKKISTKLEEEEEEEERQQTINPESVYLEDVNIFKQPQNKNEEEEKEIPIKKKRGRPSGKKSKKKKNDDDIYDD